MKTGKEAKQAKKIAGETEGLFLELTEILWLHVSRSSYGKENSALSITEHFLLEYLGKETFASMSKLSQLIQVAPTTMTSMVDRLIKRGLLERRRARQDRRKVLVTLSEEGKRFYREYHQRSLETYSRFLDSLPDKGKNFSESIQELKKIIPSLKKYLE